MAIESKVKHPEESYHSDNLRRSIKAYRGNLGILRYHFPCVVFLHLQVFKQIYFNRSPLRVLSAQFEKDDPPLLYITPSILEIGVPSVRRCIRVAIHALLQYCRLEPNAIDNEVLTPCLTLQMDH